MVNFNNMDPSKRSSISSTIISIFHVFAAVQFSYSVYYDYMFVLVPKDVFPIMSAFGGKFKFLTFWDAVKYIMSNHLSI